MSSGYVPLVMALLLHIGNPEWTKANQCLLGGVVRHIRAQNTCGDVRRSPISIRGSQEDTYINASMYYTDNLLLVCFVQFPERLEER